MEIDKIASELLGKESTESKNSYKAPKAAKKSIYKTWNCGSCGNSFFFRVFKCPLCESDVKEVAHPAAHSNSEDGAQGG